MEVNFRTTLMARLGALDEVDEAKFSDTVQSIFGDPDIELEPNSYNGYSNDIVICWRYYFETGPEDGFVKALIPDLIPIAKTGE